MKTVTTVENIQTSGERDNYALPTAMVKIRNRNSVRTSRVFFDTGSQRSFLSLALVKTLKLKPCTTTSLTLSTFGQVHSPREFCQPLV